MEHLVTSTISEPRTYGSPSSGTASASSSDGLPETPGSPRSTAVQSPLSIDFSIRLQDSPAGYVGHFELSNNGENGTPTSTSEHCIVCGEKASGKHFGTIACEACKSFFRRSIRKSRNYNCRGARDCMINNTTRNHCQYCRLQKCFRVGMKRELVQDERHSSLKPILPTVKQRLAPLIDVWACPTKLAPMPAVSTLREVDFYSILPKTDSSILMENMMNAEKKAATRHPLPEEPSAVLASSLEEVVYSFKELLLQCIDWAKLLPEFRSLGTDKRQVNVLKLCWMDIVTLTIARRRQPDANSIYLTPNLILDRNQGPAEELQRLIGRLIDDCVLPFQAMDLSEKEKACIRGLILFCPEKHTYDPEMSKRLNYFQEQLMTELEEECTVHHRCRKPNRYGKLLLRVSSLQAVAAELTRYLTLNTRFYGNVPLLLESMLISDVL